METALLAISIFGCIVSNALMMITGNSNQKRMLKGWSPSGLRFIGDEMSRNIGQSHCRECCGFVFAYENPRPITKKESKGYIQEYRALLVSNAVCVDCGSKYLAWISNEEWKYWDSTMLDIEHIVRDLSYRSTFNDEPGDFDIPEIKKNSAVLSAVLLKR